MAEIVAALVDWLPGTAPASLILNYRWTWPICEAAHFCGLVMVFGAVSFVDLRVLGMVRSVSFAAVHRLISIALVGIGISAVTGMMFISGTPDQYFYNGAFHWKLVCFAVLLGNLVWFYRFEYPNLRRLEVDDIAPVSARISAAVSLIALFGTMSAGRMLTFFRPAFVG